MEIKCAVSRGVVCGSLFLVFIKLLKLSNTNFLTNSWTYYCMDSRTSDSSTQSVCSFPRPIHKVFFYHPTKMILTLILTEIDSASPLKVVRQNEKFGQKTSHLTFIHCFFFLIPTQKDIAILHPYTTYTLTYINVLCIF